MIRSLANLGEPGGRGRGAAALRAARITSLLSYPFVVKHSKSGEQARRRHGAAMQDWPRGRGCVS